MSTRTIAIAGSSGLIGSALVAALRSADHRVVRIVRRAATGRDELFWNPDSGDFDPAGLDGVDAVVNMCGVGVGKQQPGPQHNALRLGLTTGHPQRKRVCLPGRSRACGPCRRHAHPE